MKNLIFTLILISGFGITLFGQGETESYTALRVTGNSVPVIDGTIETVWDRVPRVPLTKVPVGGLADDNITVPDPDPSDYYAEFGMVWNDEGLYVIFGVVDDVLVIYEDNDPTNSTPADKWWRDDNINLLFSKDLLNNSFTQWEFAWQPGIDQEEKLSSDDWLNPAEIDISLVSSAWHQDGTAWTLETFISWEAFDDGNAVITPDMDIHLEARARDDDDDGVDDNTWETMFQWSTTNYNIENDGIGMGTVTLSSTEVTPVGIENLSNDPLKASLVPNSTTGMTRLQLSLDSPGHVSISLYNLSGKPVKKSVLDHRPAGSQVIPMNFTDLNAGVYLLKVTSDQQSSTLKFVKR